MRFFVRSLLACLCLICYFSAPANAAEPIYRGFLSDKAVSGYDAVAYFKQHQAVKGDPKFSTKWQGVTWQFSSAENLQDFKADPKHYAPQYGGYCAYAVALNKKVSADPTAWKVVDSKLYLNYDKSIKEKWEADQKNYINDADQNWVNLSQ